LFFFLGENMATTCKHKWLYVGYVGIGESVKVEWCRLCGTMRQVEEVGKCGPDVRYYVPENRKDT